MAASSEYSLVRKNFRPLVDAVQQNIQAVATELFSMSVVDEFTLERSVDPGVDSYQRSVRLLERVLESIKKDGNAFIIFMDILKKYCPEMAGQLCKQMLEKTTTKLTPDFPDEVPRAEPFSKPQEKFSNLKDTQSELCLEDLLDITSSLQEVRHKWYEIGLALRLPVYQLEEIQESRKGDVRGLIDVIKAWLQGQRKEEKNWKTLMEVLQSPIVGSSQLSEQIKSQFPS